VTFGPKMSRSAGQWWLFSPPSYRTCAIMPLLYLSVSRGARCAAPQNLLLELFSLLAHRYIQDMVAGHTKAIQVYTKEAADAQSADLKAYANQTLPTLQKHLDGAKNLAKAKPSSKSM
jgi:hypothetical protein